MKHIRHFILALAVVFAMSSCSDTNSPISVTETFLSALQDGDYNTAFSCTTSDETLRESTVENYEMIKLHVTDYKITASEIDESGERAIVKATTTMTSAFNTTAATSDEEYRLVKVDGKWKLDF